MPGFDTDQTGGGGVLFCTNVDFTGTSFTSGSPQIISDGQLLIGSSTVPQIRVGTLGSSDGSITWTVGHGTITGQVAGGSTVAKTITGNSGGALPPTAGNWNIVGGGNITTSGSGSTLTAQLTGLVNHALLVGTSGSTLTNLTLTNGQLPIGSTGANPVAATLTQGTGMVITNAAGSITLATTSSSGPGFINLGIAYSAGTFTVQGGGAALSSTNPAYVTFRNGGSAGQTVTITVTANQTFTDGVGGTINSAKFGLPYGGTDISWANDMPFFLYAVQKTDQTAVGFMITRNPGMKNSPAAANISVSGSIINVDQTDCYLMTGTAANYASMPAVYIGCFRMQYTAGAPSFYTVQALSATSDGVGCFFDQDFTMPKGANGAATNSAFFTNGGTAPVYTTNAFTYRPQRNGNIFIRYNSQTQTTPGAGAVNAKLVLPYALISQEVGGLGNLVVTSNASAFTHYIIIANTAFPQVFVNLAVTGNVLTLLSNFTAANAATLDVCYQYVAYNN